MIKPKRYVKYHERCRSPHAGSSTCAGCDSSFWLDDDPYFKSEPKHKTEDATQASDTRESVPFKCHLCGLAMPRGEECFKYHGYSGPCPKPAPKESESR
jgi:hypothetical protein